MYSPICQAILGWGWLEIILRGSLLALVYGLIHRWYCRNANRFWPTLFYLWLMVFSYYTIRSITFGFVRAIEYWFVPAMLLVYLLRCLFSRKRKTMIVSYNKQS